MFRLAARLGLVAAGALMLVSGCQKPLSHEECSELLDRYVQLLARSDGRDAGAGELLHLEVQARAKAARDPAFPRCASKVSKSQWQCAMKAPDPDSLERCLM